MSKRSFRILLVEDDPLIAIGVAEILKELDCECIGPFELCKVTAFVHDGSFDAAFLDLINNGECDCSLAEVLAARGIPFGFTSGLPHESLDEKWKAVPYVGKPYGRDDIEGLLLRLLPQRSNE